MEFHRTTHDQTHQTRVRGRYETDVTDTAQLARELSARQDTTRILSDFDGGKTLVRDVGNMITAQRDAILEAHETGTLDEVAADYPELLALPVANLHARVIAGDQDQPVGHNFFVNATGFINAKLSWAEQLDAVVQTRLGMSVHDIARADGIKRKDSYLAMLTNNPDPELTRALAAYLAGRSLAGEQFLGREYGKVMERAKGSVFMTTQRIGATTGLRIDMLERAAGQLQRSTFGSFDHLAGLVTSDETGSLGDYQTGSLRVEVLFDGSVRAAKTRTESDAYHVIAHELHHSSSAQAGRRCGLRLAGQGLEANEGMTEYLAQLSIDTPGIRRQADGSIRVRRDVPYRTPVAAMLALHEDFKSGRSTHFATLFNAYHGDIRNPAQLEAALDTFYAYDSQISRR